MPTALLSAPSRLWLAGHLLGKPRWYWAATDQSPNNKTRGLTLWLP